MATGQSKRASLIETVANIASGFFISLAVWVYVVTPLWHLTVNPHDNLLITSVFTVTSIARSYVWRRVFNRLTLKGTS